MKAKIYENIFDFLFECSFQLIPVKWRSSTISILAEESAWINSNYLYLFSLDFRIRSWNVVNKLKIFSQFSNFTMHDPTRIFQEKKFGEIKKKVRKLATHIHKCTDKHINIKKKNFFGLREPWNMKILVDLRIY